MRPNTSQNEYTCILTTVRQFSGKGDSEDGDNSDDEVSVANVIDNEHEVT